MRSRGKLKLFIAAFLLLSIYFFMGCNVYAYNYKKILDPKYNIDKNKQWTIKFNKEIDPLSINSYTVKVFDELNNIVSDVKVRVDYSNKKSIIVTPPSSNYEIDRKYTIVVDGIKTKDGKVLSHPAYMTFVTKSIFYGLPSEKGIVIVYENFEAYNKLRIAKAYSIEYLSNNGNILNEILLKGKYAVYANDDENGRKIKSILGNGNIDKNIPKPQIVTYIDSNVPKVNYQLNYKDEYERVNPTALVDVNISKDSNRPGKVVAINVKKVLGIFDYENLKFSVEDSNSIKNVGDTLIFYTESENEKLFILSSDGDEIGVATLNLKSTSINKEVLVDVNPKVELGNHLGNLMNVGLSAKDKNGLVYYSNALDKNKLYKFNENGTQNVQISEDDAKYINVVGDYVYYSNYSDKGKLYRIKNDGTDKTKICDDTAAFVVVAGKDIYYSNHSDGGKIYTIKVDGSNAVTKLDKSIRGVPLGNASGDAGYLNVVGDYIYYINYSDDNRPYVVNKYGVYIGKLSDEGMSSMIVRGDYIYYTLSDGTIKRTARGDASSSVTLAAGDKASRINVTADALYYANYSDGNKLYKLNLLTNVKQKMTNDAIEYIAIIGNMPFYTKNFVLYKATGNLDPKAKPEPLQNTTVVRKITKVNNIDKTVELADVDKTIEELEKQYLPEKVTAFMDDYSLLELLVSWDKSKVTLKNGVRTYTGTILGYNNKIICNLTIPSRELNVSQIKIQNNSEKNAVVKVDGLSAGDQIKLYDDKYLEKPIAQSTTITKEGLCVLSKLSLASNGGKLYITVTRNGRKESSATIIDMVDAPTITKGEDADFSYLGVDGRDITINWNKAEKNFPIGQKIYILPKGTPLDVEKQKPVYSEQSNSSKSWTGDRNTKDSLEKTITASQYDIYVVAENSNSITASNPVSIKLTAEDVLKQPIIPDHVFVHGGTNYNLPFVIDREVTAWIIPITSQVDKTTNIETLTTGKMDTEFTKLIGNGLDTLIKVPSKEGEYKLILSNLAGNSPISKGIIHVDNTAPQKPIFSKANSGYFQYISASTGDIISALTFEDGKIYLINKKYYDWAIDILKNSLIKNDEEALKYTLGGRALSVNCKRGIPATIKIENIENGDYYAVAVDNAGNVSERSGKINDAGKVCDESGDTTKGQVVNIDTLGPDIVSANKRTITVAESPNDAGTDIAEVVLSEEGEVFLINSVDYYKSPDKYTKRTDLTQLINTRRAKWIATSKLLNSNDFGANITAKGLLFGEYVLAACDKAGNLRVRSDITLNAWEAPSIRISTAKFEMDISRQTDIKIPMDLRGTKLNKLYKIIDNNTKVELDEGKDYTFDVSANTILINKQYLQTIETPRLNLGLEFVNADIIVKNLNLYVDIVKMSIKPTIPKELISKHAFYVKLDKPIMDDEFLNADNIDLKVNGTPISGFTIGVLDGGYTYLITLPLGADEIKSTSTYSFGIKSNLKYSYKYNFGSAVTFTPVSIVLATPTVKLDKNGVATWNQVAGAAKYEVKLYKVADAGNATQVGTTTTVDYKQLLIDFNSAIKGSGNGTYYVTVRAKAFDDSFSTDSIEGKCAQLPFILN